MTTWKILIEQEMDERGESWDDVIDTTLTDAEALVEFDDGYGGTEGVPFTLWTRERVYFPVCYDGAEWVKSAPRSPCGERCEHVGGG